MTSVKHLRLRSFGYDSPGLATVEALAEVHAMDSSRLHHEIGRRKMDGENAAKRVYEVSAKRLSTN